MQKQLLIEQAGEIIGIIDSHIIQTHQRALQPKQKTVEQESQVEHMKEQMRTIFLIQQEMYGIGLQSLTIQGPATPGPAVVVVTATTAPVQRHTASATFLTSATIPSGYAAAYSSNNHLYIMQTNQSLCLYYPPTTPPSFE